MVANLARELLGLCADALDLRHARDSGEYIGNRDRCETMTFEETTHVGAE
jgi:hypothetical protein